MSLITRDYEAQVDSVMDGEKSVVARINTGCIDEYRTVIDPMGGELIEYNNNPPVLWQHGKEVYRGHMPIGRGYVRARKSENDIIGKCMFAKDDFSQQLFDMYKDGTLRGWSINMLPREASPPTPQEIRARPELEQCEMVFRKWTLKEFSAVALPGNTECLTLLVSRHLVTPPDGYKIPASEPVAEDERPAEQGKRTAPYIEEVAGCWIVRAADHSKMATFTESRNAQDCLTLMGGGQTFASLHHQIISELRSTTGAMRAEFEAILDLALNGRV